MSKTTYCGECEHFEPDYDPYGLFDAYCDLYDRGGNKNSECYAKYSNLLRRVRKVPLRGY